MVIAPQFHDGPNGHIAYHRVEGDGPGLVWLGGFRSDMCGSKAEYVENWAKAAGRGNLRFDYSGHGGSEGKFRDGTISDWAADASSALCNLTKGPQILIGSSMGGWIAMLIALRHPERVGGLVLIAPAPDFTETLMWSGMNDDTRAKLLADGVLETPSDYSDEPDIITRALIEDGRNNLVLDKCIPVKGPVRILQGMRDDDVPWQHAMKAIDSLDTDDIEITLIKAGDHRLSTPPDLERLGATLHEVLRAR